MVECHVSGKVFVKKLETLLTSTLDQYTYVETDYKQSPEDETVSGACFYLPYTFAGLRQNELYFNTLVLLILNRLFACHRVITVFTARGQTF